MSAQFSIKDAEKKIEDINFPKYVQLIVKEKGENLYQLSQQMNQAGNFLSQRLSRRQMSLPLLVALSMHLRSNLFEPFLSLLPDALQVTRREAALQAEIDRLKGELAAMTKERDIYREVAVGK